MKSPTLICLCLASGMLSALDALPLPGDGSDGVLQPAASIEIDLSQAVEGTWDANNGANAGKGIYDPNKWVIVFKYASVQIPAGVTVTFKNHPSRAPVIWIVSGNVTIDGTVSVNGKQAGRSGAAAVPAEPGPGGFRGGCARPDESGNGMGPAGGTSGGPGYYYAYYGNDRILPAIGGSGGCGNSSSVYGGAGGGGSITIACANSLSVGSTGSITANSGIGSGYMPNGSGGAIRLIGQQVIVTGSLMATTNNFGPVGRIRIESAMTSILTPPAGTPFNPTPVVAAPDSPVIVVQPDNSPTVRVARVALPADLDQAPEIANPLAPLDVAGDVSFPSGTAPLVIEVQTTNFPTTSGRVFVRIAKKFGGAQTEEAFFHDGDFLNAHWRTNPVTFSDGFTVLQARATGP